MADTEVLLIGPDGALRAWVPTETRWRYDVLELQSLPPGQSLALAGQPPADLDGDGDGDRLVQADDGRYFAWLRAEGSHSFTPQQIGLVEADATAQGLGDFNGDGRADILWVDPDGDVSWWLSSGGPGLGFTRQELLTVPSGWLVEGVGDFDGDGRADILWRNPADGRTDLWLIQPDLTVVHDYLGVVPPRWEIAKTADFNGDGKTDILWRNNVDGHVDIWTSRSASGHLDLGVVDLAWTPVLAEDLDGDGRADIFWQNADGGTATWYAEGDGTFPGGRNDPDVVPDGYFIDPSVRDPAFVGGDLTGDGRADILLKGPAGSLSAWTATDEAGVFTPVSLPTIPQGYTLLLEGDPLPDFNGDGKGDLLLADGAFGYRAWLGGDAGLSFESQEIIGLGRSVVAAADFNGDGKSDLLYQTEDRRVLLQTSNAGPALTYSALQLYTPPPGWSVNSVGDFNGDGRADILWRQETTGEADLWLVDGDLKIQFQHLGVVDPDWTIAKTADFDGDGKTDILWRNVVDGHVDIWTTASAANHWDVGPVDLAWTPVQTEDFNADGRADILWQGSDGELELWYAGDERSFLKVGVSPGRVPNGAYIDPDRVNNTFTAGDFDQDGKADLLITQSDRRVLVSTPALDSRDIGGLERGDRLQATAQPAQDYNGDGVADVLIRKADGRTLLWASNASSGFDVISLPVTPAGWTIEGVGDIDGDARADILWRGPGGRLDIWTNPASGVFTHSDLGLVDPNLRLQAVADVTGDGRSDLVWRDADGDVVLWTTRPGADFAISDLGPVESNWRLAGAGDFTGDGKADLLWRGDDGEVEVWIARTGDPFERRTIGSMQPEWQVQQVADYDGDGQLDILWRRDDGQLTIWTPRPGATAFDASNAAIATPDLVIRDTLGGRPDLTGDGRADILVAGPNGALTVWSATETRGVFTQRNLPSLGAGESVLSWSQTGADLNLDGRLDLLVRGSNGHVFAYVSNPTSLTFTSYDLGVGTVGLTPQGAADFNVDGRTDLLWRRDDGLVQQWYLDDETALSFTVRDREMLSNDWRSMGIGNLNGDGTADFLWRNVVTGEGSSWLTDPNLIRTHYNGYAAIPTTSVTTSADFNGDGRLDLLLHDTATGQVTTFMSRVHGNSAVQQSAMDPSWSPVLSDDFDGDGRADVLWRHSSGETRVWYAEASEQFSDSYASPGVLAGGWYIA